MPRSAVSLLCILMSAMVLIGCQTGRPADTIRANADFLQQQGDYEAAAAEYAQITDRYPGDWEAQYQLGKCLSQIDRLSEARSALEVAHTLNPRNEEVADALADVMYRQKDESHLFAFLRQRADATRSVYAYRRMANYSMLMGDPDTARVALETAMEVDDGPTVGLYLDAATHAERIGDLDLAIRRLRQAYTINPDNRVVQERLRALGEIPGPTLSLEPGR